MSVEKLGIMETSELDIATQRKYAEDFMDEYNEKEGNIFAKVFPDKIIDYMTSNLKWNVKDALWEHLMGILDPELTKRLSAARAMIIDGEKPTYEKIKEQLKNLDEETAQTQDNLEIMDPATTFSPQDINYFTRFFPYKEGNCSGNVREWLDNIHNEGYTDMFIPALNRAQMHWTLARKQLLSETSMMKNEAITIGWLPAPDATFKGMNQAIDFSQESTNPVDVKQQVNKISAMKWNTIVLVFANKGPNNQVQRGKWHPGHASIAFKWEDGEIYVHDGSFAGGAIKFWGKKENIFELSYYLKKLQNSKSDGKYHLDSAISGNISKPEATSPLPPKATIKS